MSAGAAEDARTNGAARARRASAAGLRVVFTNGCFDILHPGHISLLRTCASLGDFLVVGVNTDRSVRGLKGPSRPVVPLEGRMRVLESLRMVDLVIPFDEDTPLALIGEILPAVLVKGGDYTRDTVVGASEVEAAGGRVVIVPLEGGWSTTGILSSGSARG
jgi:D-beta-D-heptose 7-phosphate kinase/D-beta-D-heptose 1-phosphate adenosyltransferase